jgi:hypothetical protein
VGERESGRVGEWEIKESWVVEAGKDLSSPFSFHQLHSLTSLLSHFPALPLSHSPTLPLPHSPALSLSSRATVCRVFFAPSSATS